MAKLTARELLTSLAGLQLASLVRHHGPADSGLTTPDRHHCHRLAWLMQSSLRCADEQPDRCPGAVARRSCADVDRADLTLLRTLVPMTMAMQYIYGLTDFEVAVAFIPTQIFSIAGAAWTGRLVQRKGVAFAGSLLLLIVALSLGVSALVLVTTPIWVCILIVSIYSAAAVGAGVALTNAIMDLARKGDDGSASAYRGAAMNLGTAIGVAAMTGVVFFAASSSLQEQAVSAGLDPSTATQVATEMRDGATSEEASSLYAVPLDEVDEIDSLQQNAYLVGFHAHGAVGGAITLVAAGLFYVVRRRQEAGILEVPKVEPTSAA